MVKQILLEPFQSNLKGSLRAVLGKQAIGVHAKLIIVHVLLQLNSLQLLILKFITWRWGLGP